MSDDILMDCCNCGNCCKYVVVYIPSSMFGTKDIQWYLCHGCSFVMNEDKDLVGIKVPNRCRCLDENNKCTIYNTELFPETCRKFAVGVDINCEAKKLPSETRSEI